jgi:hypothetical protein
LFGVTPYLAVMGALMSGAVPISDELALILAYYFTLYWPLLVALLFIALDHGRIKTSESEQE